MKIRYWGVRGSIPVPGKGTLGIGGNTPCVSIELHDGAWIVIDAGTGIRNLGRELMRCPDFAAGRGRATLLISHRHWDHIHGLPFFEPAYVAGNVFDVYEPASRSQQTPLDDNVVSLSYSPENFPVSYETMKRAYRFHPVAPDQSFRVAHATVRPLTLNHPAATFGYVITERSGIAGCDTTATVAYLSDTGPWTESERRSGNREAEGGADSYYWDHVIPALSHADLVIHDTFFEEGHYEARSHWGHSTPTHALHLCHDAGVRRLHLFHFAPDLDDEDVAAMVRVAREHAGALAVEAAYEGMEIVLPRAAVVSVPDRS